MSFSMVVLCIYKFTQKSRNSDTGKAKNSILPIGDSLRGPLAVDGVLAVLFMPHNPFAWAVCVLTSLLAIVAKIG